MKQIILTATNHNPELLARKIKEAYLAELNLAFSKAEKAVRENRTATIRTKCVRIEINQTKP